MIGPGNAKITFKLQRIRRHQREPPHDTCSTRQPRWAHRRLGTRYMPCVSLGIWLLGPTIRRLGFTGASRPRNLGRQSWCRRSQSTYFAGYKWRAVDEAEGKGEGSSRGSAKAGFSFVEHMDMAFNLLSCWVWRGKGHEAPNATPCSSSDSRMGFREPDYMQFSAVNGRRIKRKLHSLEERQIDREYDVVLVPPDGGCVSDSQSDESDWSIGWLEPHAPEFQNERETENSFAVLVPCYGRGRYEQVDSKKHVLGAF
ncbi:hypothetical protein BHE74_00007169 [Ensete ventricosum]|nr:hypothetical protein BHE74_00007169 [Ensete ventricosum]